MTTPTEHLNPEFASVQDVACWLAESNSVCRQAKLKPVVHGHDGRGALVNLACLTAAFDGKCGRTWAAFVDQDLGGRIIRLQNQGRCPTIQRG